MHDIDPALKREIYQTQQELIEQGWDDVELIIDDKKHDPNELMHAILSYHKKFARFTVMKDGSWRRWYRGADKLTTEQLIQEARGYLCWHKVHELVSFAEKPGSFHDVMKNPRHVVSWSKVKRIVDEGLLKVYESRKLFSTPLVTPGSGFRALSPVSKHEKVIVVSFDFDTVGFRYMLADLTDAVTYVRSWAYATTVEAEHDEDF